MAERVAETNPTVISLSLRARHTVNSPPVFHYRVRLDYIA